MAYHVTHLRWLESWREQLQNLRTSGDYHLVHRWLWSSWKYRGVAIASDLNEGLGVPGPAPIQADTPLLCVGQVDAPQVLFVHMHPGWEADPHRREEPIVKISDRVALNFYRAFFTSCPEAMHMTATWNHAIGLGWRLTHGHAPTGIPADVKRAWANCNVAGWSLLPLRCRSQLLDALKDTPTGRAVEAAMASSLLAALRLGAQTTLVASRDGAAFVDGMAQRWGWPELDAGDARLPQGSKAYEVADQLVLAMPRTLLGGDRSLRLDPMAEAIAELQVSRRGHGRRRNRRSVA